MKSKVAFAILASTIILASVIVAIPPVHAAIYNFTLEAGGQARDRSGGYHDVLMSLTGTGSGLPSSFMSFSVGSGTLNVEGYGVFRIIGGFGRYIARFHYIYFYIRIAPLYGGGVTFCSMFGRTGVYYASEIPLTLSSRFIVIPTLPRYTILYGLFLVGEITLS
ncbi:MAG: hypothetical protein HXX80_04370 [Nitrososphaerales archaeon]|nr:hypothetical protein [Nitrososphaerales archaeon]